MDEGSSSGRSPLEKARLMEQARLRGRMANATSPAGSTESIPSSGSWSFGSGDSRSRLLPSTPGEKSTRPYPEPRPEYTESRSGYAALGSRNPDQASVAERARLASFRFGGSSQTGRQQLVNPEVARRDDHGFRTGLADAERRSTAYDHVVESQRGKLPERLPEGVKNSVSKVLARAAIARKSGTLSVDRFNDTFSKQQSPGPSRAFKSNDVRPEDIERAKIENDRRLRAQGRLDTGSGSSVGTGSSASADRPVPSNTQHGAPNTGYWTGQPAPTGSPTFAPTSPTSSLASADHETNNRSSSQGQSAHRGQGR
jgi:hypothetical protein